MNIIQSKNNQWIKLCQTILEGKRESKNYFIAEGNKLIESLLQTYKSLALLTNEEHFQKGISNNIQNCLIVANELWPKITEMQSPVKLIGIFEKPNYSLAELENAEELIILDQVQDPGNLGTIIRTAVAAGWKNLICLKGTVNPFSAKVVRSSAGALGGVKIFIDIKAQDLLPILEENKFTIINSSSYAEQDLRELDLASVQKPCLILGNEGQGSQSIFREAPNTIQAKIPIVNTQIVESLNVAIAGALLIYKIKKLI